MCRLVVIEFGLKPRRMKNGFVNKNQQVAERLNIIITIIIIIIIDVFIFLYLCVIVVL
jgi:hypothetical protein